MNTICPMDELSGAPLVPWKLEGTAPQAPIAECRWITNEATNGESDPGTPKLSKRLTIISFGISYMTSEKSNNMQSIACSSAEMKETSAK
ncbi:hypothetical protein T265_16130, partial [Opisthorchis viverrini]